MDNTDRKKRVILINRKYNHLTGETVIRTKPKINKREKIVLAEGKGTKTIGEILLARVRPFNFVIKTLLIRRGYNVSGLNFQSKVIIFYNEYAAGEVGRTKIDFSEFINNVSFKLKPDDELTEDINETRNRVEFLKVTDVADTIVKCFKTANFRYESLKIQGLEPKHFMTDEQLLMAKATFIVMNRLSKKLQSDHFLKKSEVIVWLKWIVGLLILYYILKNL